MELQFTQDVNADLDTASSTETDLLDLTPFRLNRTQIDDGHSARQSNQDNNNGNGGNNGGRGNGNRNNGPADDNEGRGGNGGPGGNGNNRDRDFDDDLTIVARAIDGTGTNEENADWGASHQELLRLAPNSFADGISEIDDTLPNARLISNTLAAQTENTENSFGVSNLLWAWGQFIDHDLDLTEAGETGFSPIVVPDGDPVFADDGIISFNRVEPVEGTGEGDVVAAYENEITAFMDASMVYGSNAETAASLRDGAYMILDEDGLLLQTESGVLAGDVRAAENIALTSLHTLFAREHNRLVDELAEENQDLTSDELFDAARMRVEAEIQAITFNEFHSVLLGEDAIAAYEGYDSSVNPGISVEFSTAAYRFGHTLLSSEIERLNEDGSSIDIGSISLQDAFFNPGAIAESGGIESILRGLAGTTAQEIDNMIVEDVRSFLFAPTGEIGLDLASLNIQRGRDLGVSSYNDLREAFGLERVESFDEITSDADIAAKLEALYGDVDNIDAWVGGLAEDPAEDGMLGETFSLVIIDQFTRLRDGDAYWSEAGQFSDEELEALWGTTLSDVILANTEIDSLQDSALIAAERIGGTDADDVLTGTEGADLLFGEDGDDTLEGGSGDDQLEGGSGADVLSGGEGDDVLYGDGGADTFVFLVDGGNDLIMDFGRNDTVEFDEAFTFTEDSLSQVGTDALLTLDADTSVTFVGTDIQQIDDLFAFV